MHPPANRLYQSQLRLTDIGSRIGDSIDAECWRLHNDGPEFIGNVAINAHRNEAGSLRSLGR